MTLAYVFLSLGLATLLFFLYFLDLAVFCYLRQKDFLKHGTEITYLFRLESEHKKKKHPQKKNYLLHLIIQTLVLQKEKEKAEKLYAFLKEDFLLNIKRSDR